MLLFPDLGRGGGGGGGGGGGEKCVSRRIKENSSVRFCFSLLSSLSIAWASGELLNRTEITLDFLHDSLRQKYPTSPFTGERSIVFS